MNCVLAGSPYLLIRRKAEDNNQQLGVRHWTPRKIDMVIWGVRDWVISSSAHTSWVLDILPKACFPPSKED